jgi:monofunctional glycosyltransferase
MRKGWFRPLRWIRIAVVCFLASTVAAVLVLRFVPPILTPLMAIRSLQHAMDGDFPTMDKDWRRLDGISPRLAEAVVASEDQRFFVHHGFDFGAIGSALSANGKGKRKLGASTITQQTAKNLFLWPDRSWTRKGLEVYFTLLLELLWSKRRILEVYLNIIETGDGIYGAEAAAQAYFKVSAAELTAEQAALLAAILPNPRKWSPVNPTAYLQRRQNWILRQMDHLGPMPQGLSRGKTGAAGGQATSSRPRQSSMDTASGPAAPDGILPAAPPALEATPAPEQPVTPTESALPGQSAPSLRPESPPAATPYPDLPPEPELPARPSDASDSQGSTGSD